MYVGYSRNVIKPLFDPLSPDLLFEKNPNEAENLWNDRFYNGIDLTEKNQLISPILNLMEKRKIVFKKATNKK